MVAIAAYMNHGVCGYKIAKSGTITPQVIIVK